MNMKQGTGQLPVRKRAGSELWFPARLYDREKSMDTLLAAYSQARDGETPCFVAVTGPSGIGKTALVREFRGRLSGRGAAFISGVFTSASRDEPGVGFLNMVRELAASPAYLESPTEEFKSELEHERALINIHIPELERFMDAAATGASEVSSDLSEERDGFPARIFRILHEAHARKGEPPIVFLDDVDLADDTSLNALLEIAGNSKCANLLLIAAWDPERTPESADLLERIKSYCPDPVHLEPNSLRTEAISNFLADTLNQPRDSLSEFAELVSQWTGGNPGSMAKFLREMHAAEHLRLSPESTWSWDIEAMQAVSREIASATPSGAPSERHLRESEEKYRLLFSAESDAILIFREDDQRLEDVNEAALQLYGYTRHEMLQLTADEITDGPGNSLFRINELVTGKLRNISHWYHRRKDGSRFPVEISTGTFPLRGRTMICAIVRDISERKEMEERYKRQKAYYERILNHIDTDIAVLDLDFRYEYLNRRAVPDPAIRRRLIGKDDYDFAEKDRQATDFADRRRMHLRQVIDEKKSVEFEEESITSDGKREHNLRKLSPILNSNKEVTKIIGHGVDITERKLAEEALRESEQEVRKLNEKLEERVKSRTHQLEAVIKELEAFSYSVSHDLRAPLRAINGFATVLLQDFAERLDESALHYLNRIRANAGTMAQLIDDLLEFSRLGRRRMQIETIDLEQMTRVLLEELEQINPHTARKIRIHPLPPVDGDAKLIRQMLFNLLSNAVKFSSEREKPEIEVGFVEKKNRKVYFIKDNGAGFDMKYSDKLFGVFQRLHPRDEFEGTGVGLAIVNRIVDLHGGFVWAEGIPDQGATFFFTL